jgi:hypothetical protein
MPLLESIQLHLRSKEASAVSARSMPTILKESKELYTIHRSNGEGAIHRSNGEGVP